MSGWEELRREVEAMPNSSPYPMDPRHGLVDRRAVLAAIDRAALSGSTAREEWRDHVPSGYEDQTGYGQVSCSCGWDSSDVLGWEQHINAAASPDPAQGGET